MKHWDSLRAVLRSGRLLIGLILALSLVGCSLGEAVMPSPPTGVPADRSVGVVAPVPAPIPHSLEGRDQCFGCHAIGAVDAPPVPADHEQDVTLCTTCHAVWSVSAVASAASPAIPHEVEGREDCLVCHKLGTADAPRTPDNHDGLTSDSCQTCHTQMAEIAGVAEAEMTVAEIPPIPHGLEGFGACTQCHEEGGDGIPRFPDDHAGRTDDLCTACHRPAEEGEVSMPTAEPTGIATEVPSAQTGDAANGQVIFDTSCAGCHGSDGVGTSIAPAALNDATLLGQLTDEDLATAIREGVANKMPAFANLSDQEILDLIALMRSWE